MTSVVKPDCIYTFKSRFVRDFFVLGLLVAGCADPVADSAESSPETLEAVRMQIQGTAQGSTFNIIYYDPLERDLTGRIDSLFVRVDSALSTYMEGSFINLVNDAVGEFTFRNEGIAGLFWLVARNADDIQGATDGAFDASVMPLVRYWGFGPEGYDSLYTDSLKIAELQLLTGRLIGTNSHDANGLLTVQREAGVQFDYNAIAQGYTADMIGGLFDREGISSYMIEVGGEILTGGTKPDGSAWNLGVDKPVEPGMQRELQILLGISDNRALATSGSYRKFYEKDGVRYSHTIDPRTGYPVQHSLLSVTVLAYDCWLADAMATAFMVMGVEESLQFIQDHPNMHLEAYFIYEQNGVLQEEMTSGIAELIVKTD